MHTIKNLCVAFLLFSSLFSACQKSVILKNVNSRAKELKHNLNASGDSISLVSERHIYRVEIFNKDFRVDFKTNHKKLKIPLYEIPVGRYVVLVRLRNKLIAISLLRNETYDSYIEPNFEENKIVTAVKSNTVKEKVLDKKQQTQAVENTAEAIKPSVKGYWIAKSTQGHLGEKVTRRMARKNEIKTLINLVERERKTKAGKQNKLTIWEIYDIANFKRKNAMSKSYIKSSKAVAFNVIPYYQTETKKNIASN